MIAPYPKTERQTARETAWAARRLRLAIRAIGRRWGPGSERRIAGLLRIMAESLEGGEK